MNRRHLPFLLLAIWLTWPAAAAETPAGKTSAGPAPLSARLMEASRHYQEGRFQQAYDLFSQVRADGVRNPDLEYNLGNAAFRLGRIGLAMLHYERALWLDPGHDDARFNRDYVRHFLADKIQEPGFSLPERVWQELTASVGVNGAGIIFLISFCLTLAGGVLACRFGGGGNRRWRLLWTGLPALAIMAGLLFYGMLWRQENVREAVITSRALDVRSGPSETNPVLFSVHEGLLVEVAGQVGNWRQVVLPNGWNGWIPVAGMMPVQE